MNRTLAFATALGAALSLSLFTGSAVAQSAAPAAAAAPALPAPQAIPAKIALIQFEQAAAATNEGQRVIAEIQKTYEPKTTALKALQADIASLTKQLQNAPATMSEEEKASRARVIDTKQKQLQRDGDDASNAYGADVQEAVDKVAQKLGPVVIKYVQQNGYTMLLDNTGPPQQGGLAILWAPGTDISQAVVEAYNASSGVAAQPPSAPAPARSRTAAPKAAPPKQ